MAERVAIVGTRKPSLRQIARVFSLVAALPMDAVVVSGGARGIDTWARIAAQFYRREIVEHKPEKYAAEIGYIPACFKRNTDIINDADTVEALPGPEFPKRGGTADSVQKARQRGKPLRVWFYPNAGWTKDG